MVVLTVPQGAEDLSKRDAVEIVLLLFAQWRLCFPGRLDGFGNSRGKRSLS